MKALKRAFGQPAFLVCFVVLAICAGTLNGVVKKLSLDFHKKAVPLRISLKEGIPPKMGHWVCVSTDQAIDPETEQVLGTSLYVFRDYVDDRKVDLAEIEQMKNESVNAREALLNQIQTSKPSAVLRVGVTYYTGSADTVAHVPERCYVADGFEVKDSAKESATLGNYPDGSPRDVEYRFLGFEDQASTGKNLQRVARNVGYVFQCDGGYESSSYEVRRKLQNLFERYGYYAKIEMMTAATINPAFRQDATQANDHETSRLAMEDFLAEALPEIEKCLPDWQALHAKKK